MLVGSDHYYGIIRDVDNREAGGIPFRVRQPSSLPSHTPF